MSADASAGTIETRKDMGGQPSADVQYWLMQLKIVEKEDGPWVRKGRKIVKRYRADVGTDTTALIDKYNILWANTETLKPWLYNRVPKPIVERRFNDKDPIGLLGSRILERALSYEDDADDFDSVMRACVEDRLLPGRGIARIRYVAHFGDVIEAQEADDVGTDEAEGDAEAGVDAAPIYGPPEKRPTASAQPPAERQVDWEEAPLDYVFWEDFRCAPARRWTEVTWVGFRSYLTRTELVKRFPHCGDKITLDYTPKGLDSGDRDGPQADAFKKAVVWEIWDKSKREVVWIAPSYTEAALDCKKDPLELTGFFPCPCPLVSTTTNDKMQPVPDYVEYQDQAAELDMLTARIGGLMQALQVKGIYAGSMKASITQLLDPNTENKLIAVDDWPAFADKGGLKNMIEWLPIEQIAAVLAQSFQAREQVKAVIHEITGLADILRANTNPNETLGAQQLKSNYATMRLTRPQQEVARFARDLIRLRGEVMARHFDPRTLAMMTNLPEAMPDPPVAPEPLGGNAALDPEQSAAWAQGFEAYQQAMAEWQAESDKRQKEFLKACDMLRDDAGRGFRVDIEADSTIAADEQQDKQQSIEFITSITSFMEKAIPAVQNNPILAPLMCELLMFSVRQFHAGRSMEAKFEEACEKILEAAEKAASAPKQAPQDPQAQALALKAQADIGKNQVAAQKVETEAQVEMRGQDIKAADAAEQRSLDRDKAETDATIAAAREVNADVRAVKVLQ